jgi:hypothetical protein
MIPVDCVRTACEGLRATPIQNNSIQEPIALGINGVEADNRWAWTTLKFAQNQVSECELLVGDKPLKDPHTELGVEIAVVASSEAWLEIGAGGMSAAVKAADERKFVVGGKLPYFIRNVRSLLEIVVLYAAELKRSADQV